MRKQILITILGAILSLTVAIPAQADLWGTNTGLDLTQAVTGSRESFTSPNQLDGIGGWVENFKISWVITPPESGSNLWTYAYTFTGDTPNISHLILGFTNPITATELIYSGEFEFNDDWQVSPSNPSMPGEIYGFKFDELGEVDTVTFQIARSPVWGDFYAKGGSSDAAWNVGLDPTFAGNRDSTDTYIVRPNGVVPIPGAVWLLGSGLLGLLGLRHRRK